MASTKTLPIGPVIPIAKVELRWKEKNASQPVDIDLAAVICSSYGELLDIACFNQIRFYNGAIMHSGDQRDGSKNGIDEWLQIDFSRLPPSVGNILICVTFAKVEHAHPTMKDLSEFRLTLNGEDCNLDLKELFKSSQHSFVPILLTRIENTPQFAMLQPLEASKRRGLEEIWPVCDRVLARVIDPVLWAERPQQSVDHLNLKKDQTVIVDHSKEDGLMFFGLGWDANRHGRNIDLDAHCYAINTKGKIHEHVYFGNLRAGDDSVRHSGDNLTGDGDGDDERIYINLDKMDPNVQILIFAVKIFTTGFAFKDIANEKMRVVNAKNKVVAMYALDNDEAFDSSKAGIFGILRRVGRLWRFEAVSRPIEKDKSDDAYYLLQAIGRA